MKLCVLNSIVHMNSISTFKLMSTPLLGRCPIVVRSLVSSTSLKPTIMLFTGMIDHSLINISQYRSFLGTAALSARSPFPPPTSWSCTYRRVTIPSSQCSLKGHLPISAFCPPAPKPFGVPKSVMLTQLRFTSSLLISGLTQLREGKRREEKEEGSGRRVMRW